MDHLITAGHEILDNARQSQYVHRPSWPDAKTEQFVGYWFDDDVIREMHALARSISNCEVARPIQLLLWCAFSRMIIVKAGGVSRAMDLSHSRPHRVYSEAPSKPFDRYLREVELVATRSNRLWPEIDASSQGTVYRADARALPIKSASIDCIITSPPYLNAIDYIRTSKFALVWMGYSIPALGRIRSSLVGADSARGTELTDLVPWCRFGAIGDLETRHQRVVARYVADITAVIGESARVLRQKGNIALVVGNCAMRGVYIQNAEIVKWAMEQNGMEVVSESVREIPDNRRSLPPPPPSAETTEPTRLRQEVVIAAVKS